jgi:hypothetical protein
MLRPAWDVWIKIASKNGRLKPGTEFSAFLRPFAETIIFTLCGKENKCGKLQ